MVCPAGVPVASKVHAELATAYFHDSFEVAVRDYDRTPIEMYFLLMARIPGWVNFLMTVRNWIVALFGLKDLGRFSEFDAGRSASSYKVGDRVGIFSILSLSDQELVLGDADKHLNAKVSLYKHPGEHRRVAVTTVVHVHNFLGRAYLFFVVPVHKLIVPAVLARLADAR